MYDEDCLVLLSDLFWLVFHQFLSHKLKDFREYSQ